MKARNVGLDNKGWMKDASYLDRTRLSAWVERCWDAMPTPPADDDAEVQHELAVMRRIDPSLGLLDESVDSLERLVFFERIMQDLNALVTCQATAMNHRDQADRYCAQFCQTLAFGVAVVSAGMKLMVKVERDLAAYRCEQGAELRASVSDLDQKLQGAVVAAMEMACGIDPRFVEGRHYVRAALAKSYKCLPPGTRAKMASLARTQIDRPFEQETQQWRQLLDDLRSLPPSSLDP